MAFSIERLRPPQSGPAISQPFGNDGGLAGPHADLFAIPRISMSDAVQGARFRALLMSRKSR
jgi:hypothetical protein